MALAKVRALAPDTYHGVQVMDLHVDDPIPTPRAPERYAVRVYPDLARYWLTLNYAMNRSVRHSKVEKFVSDMRDDLWRFTPESLVFSDAGALENGQHRLWAVTEYGSDVWMMCDFGWPTEIIYAIDRGSPRSNVDAFRLSYVPNPALIASMIAYVERYDLVVGKDRSYNSIGAPTSQAVMAIYAGDEEAWQAAGRAGIRVYRSLDKGLAPSVWAAAYCIIERARPGLAQPFFDAIAEGTGEPRSVTRLLGEFYRRRPVTLRRTADTREPIENIVRAFNAYRTGRSFAWVKQAGFVLSHVK